jgi:hypothetical protein
LLWLSSEAIGPPPKESAADQCQQNDPDDRHPNDPTNRKPSDQDKNRQQDAAANNRDGREVHRTEQIADFRLPIL